ncbi:hypothetical protein CC78DRAFT_206530 [Lojkania enalia]|uniref:Uncharacterized protein n=1 Tax=Lojkania enalia TaxID=147567 RepID=A0A9P4N0G3_9PLEO|nr:hypothetical protein CC78DRAFT_206530 [Didymosphaeria enalia]
MRHTAINTPDQDSQDVCDSFNWLSRSNRGKLVLRRKLPPIISRLIIVIGLEFISYSHYSHFPASSFDFGHRGYAARCSYGGQLLHLSAPSENHGLISVRGDFENSLYAALARAQRDDGGCSSFGLEFVDGLEPYHPRGTFLGSKKTGSTFIFGDSIDRGCLNYRWPYNERPLFLNEDSEISKAKNKWSVIEYKLGIWASRMRNKRSRKGVEEYKCNIEEAGTKEQKSHADATAGDMEVVYPYETREQFLNDVDRLFYEVTNRKLETDALWKMTTSDLRNLVGIDETEIENALDKDVSGIELLSLFGFRACGGEKHTGAIGSNDNDFNGSTKASGNSSSETLKAGEMIFSESAMSSTKASSGSEMSMKREREVGTCVTFSFIMHGTLYQILRVEQGAPSDHNTGTDQSDMFDNESQIVLRIGGLVRFSIPSSTMPSEIEEVTDNSLPSQHGHDNSGGDTINSLKFRARALGLTLEARIYQFEPTEPDGGKTSGNTCPHYRLLSLQKKPKEENYKRPIRNSSSAYRAFGRFSTQFGPQTKNNATFIAAIRLSDNPLDGQRPWRIPTPREIYNFVGLSKLRTYRSQATGALWETVFFQRCLVQNSLSRFEEVHLIGRSLERILQVDNVPFQFSPRQKASGCSVLINNTFMQPAIDYKSLFWKIRFLVKLHNFLQRLKRNSRREAQARSVNSKSSHVESISGNEKTLSVDFLDAHEEAPLKEMVAAQMTRIRKVLREIIQSLVQVLIHTVLDPSTMDRLFPTTDVSEESKRYYIIITLWYVVKNFGLAGSQWRQLGIIEGLLPLRKRSESLSDWFANTILPADDKIFRARDKGKISLLQWHHYGSILGLCQNGFLPGKWIRDNNLRSKVLQHQRAALVASAAKLSSTSPYSASDEIFDRLAFLGLELGLEKLTHDGSSVAALSMRRITNRDYTRSINQGKVEPNENGDFDGPWEVHALCHHSRLKVLQLESEDGGELSEQEENELREKLHVYKHKVSQFLNSEATIIPCWERSHIEARQGWIYSEASSVLASTLLDINTRYIQERFQDTQTRVQQTDQQLEALEDIWDTGYYQTQALEKLKEEMERQSRLLERLSPDAGYLPPVEWNNTWKLPRRYHPDNFIVSLEDTPWEYDPAKLEKTVTVPQPLRPFVNSPIGRDGGRFTIEDLKHLPDLSLIRIFDISDSTEERLKPNRVVDTRNDLVAKLYDSVCKRYPKARCQLKLIFSLSTKMFGIDYW